jgi:hypothetical protein
MGKKTCMSDPLFPKGRGGDKNKITLLRNFSFFGYEYHQNEGVVV